MRSLPLLLALVACEARPCAAPAPAPVVTDVPAAPAPTLAPPQPPRGAPPPGPTSVEPEPPPLRPGPVEGSFTGRLAGYWGDGVHVVTADRRVFELSCGLPCVDEALRAEVGHQVRVDWEAAPRKPSWSRKPIARSIARTDRSTGPRRSDVQPPDADALLVCPKRAPGTPPDEATEWCEPTARGSFDADFVAYEVGDYVVLRVRFDDGEQRTYSCGRGCDDEVVYGNRPPPGRIRVRWHVAPAVFLEETGFTGPSVLIDEIVPLTGPPRDATPPPRLHPEAPPADATPSG